MTSTVIRLTGRAGASIDPSCAVPIFRQIASHICRAVAAGVYEPGEAIPSIRRLALELKVNPNTVQRAFEQLEREGLIESRRGHGMFVTKNGTAAARKGSEAAVLDAFEDGIRIARAANVPSEKIRETFELAWQRTPHPAEKQP